WHVDLGTGLAIVAMFHLTWHLGYYRRIPAGESTRKEAIPWKPHLDLKPFDTRSLFVLLGMVSIIAQLVLLREFIKTFQGNELIISVYLAVWMILTAAGAKAGTRYPARISLRSLLGIFLILGTLPVVIYLLLLVVTRYIFLPGYEPGMLSSFIYAVLTVMVFSLPSGFLFSYLARSVTGRMKDGSFYMLDSLGSLAGGILFGLILVFILDNLQVLSMLLLLVWIAISMIFRYPERLMTRTIYLSVAALIFAILLVPGVLERIESLRYRGTEMLETSDTPFGNLAFTRRDGQVTGYLDGNPAVYSFDLARSEETVHYPALQHPSPASFLLIGGGLSGLGGEVAAYDPVRFDYCETNPWIYRIGKKYLRPGASGGYNFIGTDGRSWLMKAPPDTRYDVIISAVTEPLTIGWNRYFTRDFFLLARQHLEPGGVLCTQLTTGGNYISDEGNDILKIHYQTLKEVFKNVLIVPGYATYFIASDRDLSLDFPALAKKRGIQATYVNGDYLDVDQVTFNSDLITEQLKETGAGINTDLRPLLFFRSIAGWKSRTGEEGLGVPGVVGLLLFLLLYFRYKPLQAGMYSAGFTGAGIQILLILVIQSMYGFAYFVAPLMITAFMAGLTVGTLAWKRIWKIPTISGFTGLTWIMALLCAVTVVLLRTEQVLGKGLTGHILPMLINVINGMIVGSVYGMGLSLEKDKGTGVIGEMYSADLAGAALGTFLPPVFLLPLIGVSSTFIFFCGINVATGLYILTRWRKTV
ncbi:MAG: hypothetical protein EHM46_01765, partial [Bacteroidetes bacterium]